MNKAFEKENNLLLAKLREILVQLVETTNCIEKLKQKSSPEIQEKIVEIKYRLEKLKKQKQESESNLLAVKSQTKRSIEEKVEDLGVESVLKKEAKALDKAIRKVTRAEKFCNTTLSKTKIELVSAELACLQAIATKAELDEIIHQ